MNLEQYVKITGLEDLAFLSCHGEPACPAGRRSRIHGTTGHLRSFNTIVRDAFQKTKEVFTEEELKNLYTYSVPKLGLGGTCSLTQEYENKPYNLAQTLRLTSEVSRLKSHRMTLRLWRLNQIVAVLEEQAHIDWIGIYRKIEKSTGEVVLLKEAYRGRPSRAEFPLTDDFASHSNNSTVGLTGKGIIIQSVQNYNGPYYQCDTAVQSECCLPLLHQNGTVTGIIDAESFQPEFFTQERVLNIAQVCRDLAHYDPTFS